MLTEKRNSAMSFLGLFMLVFLWSPVSSRDDGDPAEEPTLCEVCKYLVVELKARLDETGKSREVLETGHGLDDANKRRFKYKTSELRLIEALTEPHICDKILDYNIHKERSDSTRFAKGQSETMSTLHGLVDKGVKVELGIPYHLWDKPSAEVTKMQKKCFMIVEEHEDVIEDWYKENQDGDLLNVLCRNHVLRKDETSCLSEEYKPKGENGDKSSKKDSKKKDKDKQKAKQKKKKKGDTGVKEEDNDTGTNEKVEL